MTDAKPAGVAVFTDRRKRRRDLSPQSRRRYPRLHLDVDWFVESEGCSTLGRGLEISPRGALLPVTCKGSFSSDVTLFVSLPSRARMFKARATAEAKSGKGWVLHFHDVSVDDLQLLAQTLIERYGLGALPNLERKYPRFMALEARLLRDSI